MESFSISRWDPPNGFQDEQVKGRGGAWSVCVAISCGIWLFFTDFVGQELGPYAMWQHHHTYAAAGRGGEDGTMCSDVVRCEHMAVVQADFRNFLCMYKLPLHPVGDLAHVLVSWSTGAALWM